MTEATPKTWYAPPCNHCHKPIERFKNGPREDCGPLTAATTLQGAEGFPWHPVCEHCNKTATIDDVALWIRLEAPSVE